MLILRTLKGKEREGMGRNGKEWEGMGRNGKEWEGKGREGKGLVPVLL